MYFTPLEQQERHRFIDRSVEQAALTLNDPYVQRYIGRLATGFVDRLASSVVANIINGEVVLPANSDPSCLPIVAMHPDEELYFDNAFEQQTTLQQRATLKLFDKWEPFESASTAYGNLLNNVRLNQRPTIKLSPYTFAMTGTSAQIYDAGRMAEEHFAELPSPGILLIKKRPLLILSMKPSDKFMTADALAHELTHVKQIEAEPVHLYRSQKSIDMICLRGELEAYHVGSILVAALRGGKIDMDEVLAKPFEASNLQVIIEAMRQKRGVDEYDPYRPSPAFLNQLKATYLDVVMHGIVNYEELVRVVADNRESWLPVISD